MMITPQISKLLTLVSNTTTSSGTKKMREMVRMFGRFMELVVLDGTTAMGKIRLGRTQGHPVKDYNEPRAAPSNRIALSRSFGTGLRRHRLVGCGRAPLT